MASRSRKINKLRRDGVQNSVAAETLRNMQAEADYAEAAKQADKEADQEMLNKLYGLPGSPLPLPPSITSNLPAVIEKQPTLLDLADLDTHVVTIMREPIQAYPEMYFDVFVVGASATEEAQFANMFTKAFCKKAKNIEDADVVVFNGGADVDPRLYGQTDIHETVYYHEQRDTDDISAFLVCKELGIPMVGICRGAQFLHVMNGGSLYQHIDGHNGAHSIWDIAGKCQILNVSSVHHQSCIPNYENGMKLLASANMSTKRFIGAKDPDVGKSIDVEAFWYPDTACLGVQGHPEYSGYSRYTAWVLEQINTYIALNSDLEWQGKKLRLKQSIRDKQDDKGRGN